MANEGFNPTGLTAFILRYVYQTEGAEKARQISRQIREETEKMEKAVDKHTGKQKENEKQMKKGATAMEQYVMAMKRAIIVVPVWMATRVAYQAITAAITELTDTFFKLEVNMRRVLAVSGGMGDDQIKIYNTLASAARQYYQASATSIENITEAMYQLGTAGRSTEEVLKGFSHVLDLAIGTYGDVATVGRTVAGILNVFENQLESLGSTEKQIQYVTDLLAASWQNNQVEMNEIYLSMGYLAQAGNMLNISLEQLVGSAAVMNDAMLRGGKGSRLLAQAFIKIAQESDKLEKIGVVFDPYAPLDFYNVMEQLHKIFVEQGQSLNLVAEMQEIFGRQGGRAVAAILIQWEKWNEEIKRSGENIDDLGKKLKENSEKTFGALVRRTWRQVLPMPEVVPGEGGGGVKDIWADWLRKREQITDNINSIAEMFKIMGTNVEFTDKQLQSLYAHLTIENQKNLLDQISKITGLQYKEETISGGKILTGKQQVEELAKQWETIKDLGLDKVMEDVNKEMKDMPGSTQDVVSRLTLANNLLKEWVKEGKNIQDVTEDEIQLFVDYTGLHGIQLDYLKKILDKKMEMLKIDEEKNQIQVGLLKNQQLELQQIEQSAELDRMKIEGARESEIITKKINNWLERQNTLINERMNQNKDLVLSELTIEDLLAKNWDYIQQQKVGYDAIKEIVKTITELEQARLKETGALTEKEKETLRINQTLAFAKAAGVLSTQELLQLEIDLVQASENYLTPHEKVLKVLELQGQQIEENIKEISGFSEELRGTFKDVFKDMFMGEGFDFKKLAEGYKEIMADQMAEVMSQVFVTDTGLGEAFGGMMVNFKKLRNPIYRSHLEGIEAGVKVLDNFYRGVNLTGGVGVPGGYTGTTGGLPFNLSNLFGTNRGYSPMDIENMVSGQRAMPNRFGIGNLMNAGMAAYTGYQSGGVGGGLLSGLGALTGNPMLMLASMLLPGIIGSKTTTTTSSWQKQQVQDVIPVNIVGGIASRQSQYFLPESRYFSGGRTEGRRERPTIQINIESVTGTDEEIAKKIASRVADEYEKSYSRGLTNQYPL